MVCGALVSPPVSAAELKLYILSLWVVVVHYVPPPDTPGRRAERERLYIEAMQRDPKLD